MTVTRYWPFGPHTSVANNLSGITGHWRSLNAAGVPTFHKGVDSYGPILELMGIGDEFGMTATLDILRDISKGRGPVDAILTLGYTGWAPGQCSSSRFQ